MGGETSAHPLGSNNLKNLTYHSGKAVYISEAGLYSLIMRSKVPFAEAFQDLVCETILPSIRKHGSYQVEQQLNTAMEQLQQEKQRAEDAEDAEEHILLLKDLLIDDQKRDKTQLIYIATSQNYAKQNRFKIGGVESVDKLSSRFSTYNSRSAAGDEWYYSDTFLVADYRQIESRLKDLMGRFRDKKSKEIYIVHYNNIKYVIEYLCKHYSDEVDDVNAKLTEFISNLNTRFLRPVVPPPSQATFANITTLKNGNATNVLLQAPTQQDFTEKLKNYISRLDGTTTMITKKKVFDDLKVTKDRTSKFQILKEMFGQLRPEMIVKHK